MKKHTTVHWSALSYVGALSLHLGLLGAFAGDISFQRVEVDANPPENPWYKILGDINGDGQLDIIIGGAGGPLVWCAYPDWTKTQIAARGWDDVNGEAAGLDDDGNTAMVSIAWDEDRVVHLWRNDAIVKASRQ